MQVLLSALICEEGPNSLYLYVRGSENFLSGIFQRQLCLTPLLLIDDSRQAETHYILYKPCNTIFLLRKFAASCAGCRGMEPKLFFALECDIGSTWRRVLARYRAYSDMFVILTLIGMLIYPGFRLVLRDKLRFPLCYAGCSQTGYTSLLYNGRRTGISS